jgi:membrane fusion protein
MERQLFRQEAIEARSGGSLGGVRLATPLSFRLSAVIAAGIAGSILLWLLQGTYTRREHVDGNLIPQAGLITITARNVGVVSSVNVSEGELVRKGNALVSLSGERSSKAMGDTSAHISQTLRTQQRQLAEELENTQRLADQQRSDLEMQQRMLGREIEQVSAQLAIEQREASDEGNLLRRIEALGPKGYISALQIQQQRTQEMDAEQQVKALERQRTEEQQQLKSVQDQIVQLPLVTRGKLDETRREIEQNTATLAQNEADRESVISAPENGLVTAVLAKPGQSVSVGQTIMSLMPQGSSLQAQLFVPSSAIGFVHVGTPVVLHYQAFPYQKFGIQRGAVVGVSRSALTPAEIATTLGRQAPPEPLYRIIVALQSQTVKAYGKSEALKPGMLLDADLLLDKRRIFEWIFEPLFGMERRWASAG